MNALNLAAEIASLSGYTITGSSGADPTNKIRAYRRLNIVLSDIISRFGGRWPSQYREGWLALTPLYSTGTVTVTNASNTVTGLGTAWDSTMIGSKIKLSDGAYYKIATVVSTTSIIISAPFQGTTASGLSYLIWKDEYVVHPEALSIGGFLNYNLPDVMDESWPRNMKASYPASSSNGEPTVYTVIGRQITSSDYSTGTVTGSTGANTLVGVGTAWLSNIQKGYEFIIGSVTYHVKSIESDTALTLYQRLTTSPSGASYTARGKNALIVRFNFPTTQRIVNYWYNAKAYPLINDNDEDWVCEIYPQVIQDGAVVKDYLDKNDVARANMSKVTYENAIKDMKVSEDNAFEGVRTLGLNLPPAARD